MPFPDDVQRLQALSELVGQWVIRRVRQLSPEKRLAGADVVTEDVVTNPVGPHPRTDGPRAGAVVRPPG
jgi:hypothetical protein